MTDIKVIRVDITEPMIPNGTRVLLTTPGFRSIATVRGVTAKFPVVGTIYIVEPDQPMPDYPYSAVAVPQGCLEPMFQDDYKYFPGVMARF